MDQTRDIIVIGASLGGVDALKMLAGQLRADLPAAVFIVQHVAADSTGLLAGILEGAGPLAAVVATDGMELRPGRIVIAPPDRHMILTRDGVRVVFGPRENLSRPSIDPLFRTAAVNFRSRVIGVILTGLLDDGAAGLLAVHNCGGHALVQEPEDAARPDMPRHARAIVPAAEVLPLARIGAALNQLAGTPAPAAPPVPETLRIEVQLTERVMSHDDSWNDVPGHATDFTCPECRGAIRQIHDGIQRFRCRVGHAYTAESLVAAKDTAVEEALWVALQTLKERVQMLEKLVSADVGGRAGGPLTGLDRRLQETREHAARLQAFVTRLGIETHGPEVRVY